MNGRYAAYCRDHSKTPAEMQAIDERRFPGGRMTGYLCWLHSKMAEWRGTVGMREGAPLSATDQIDFDEFLDR